MTLVTPDLLRRAQGPDPLTPHQGPLIPPAPVAAPARPALLTPCAMTPPLTHTGAWAVPPVASRTAEYVAVTSTFPAPDYIHI